MSCFAVYAQDKYTGIDTDCDQSIMSATLIMAVLLRGVCGILSQQIHHLWF